jgi:periplasmic divalent cation tolerance protein
VTERLVACANITPGVRSLYRWQGEVCDEREALLVMETTRARLPEATARLRALHSYSVPKIVAIEPAEVDEDYLRWVLEQTSPP